MKADNKLKAELMVVVRNALLVHFERVTAPSPNVVQVVVPGEAGELPRYFDIRISEPI